MRTSSIDGENRFSVRNLVLFHETSPAKWMVLMAAAVLALSAAYEGHMLFLAVRRWHSPSYSQLSHILFLLTLIGPIVAVILSRRPLDTKSERALLLAIVYGALLVAIGQALTFIQTGLPQALGTSP
jgi:hypothetical protein